jgi:hypothetical protein
MSELSQSPEEEQARKEHLEYLELTREQTGSAGWTEEKRRRLLELKESLGIDQPPLTEAQTAALHRQGTAGIPLETGRAPQPPLTAKERGLIIEANAPAVEPPK